MQKPTLDTTFDPFEECSEDHAPAPTDPIKSALRLGAWINSEINRGEKDRYSLTNEEYDAYDYFLSHNLCVKNKKGKDIRPNEPMVIRLVLLEHRFMMLNKTLYVYDADTGIYKPDRDGIITKSFINKHVDDEFTTAQRIKSIYSSFCDELTITKTDREINARPKHWIHFKNGYFDYKTQTWHDHDPNYYDLHVLPWEFDPIKYPYSNHPIFDSVFNADTMGDADTLKMTLQYIGYCMTLDTSLQKFLFVVGIGGSGKSTLLRMVEEIIGRDNCCSIGLQELSEPFGKCDLHLKQMNIRSDLPLTALKEIDAVKQLTGEDTISANVKFKDRISFKSYARLLFCANDIPLNNSDRSNALYRRLMIVKMNTVPQKPDPYLSDKLHGEIPNIISHIIRALVLSGGTIEESNSSKELVKEVYKNSDSVEAFIEDYCIRDADARIDRVLLYNEYERYCSKEERPNLSRTNFYRALKAKGFSDRGTKKGYDIIGLKRNSVILLAKSITAVN